MNGEPNAKTVSHKTSHSYPGGHLPAHVQTRMVNTNGEENLLEGLKEQEGSGRHSVFSSCSQDAGRMHGGCSGVGVGVCVCVGGLKLREAECSRWGNSKQLQPADGKLPGIRLRGAFLCPIGTQWMSALH